MPPEKKIFNYAAGTRWPWSCLSSLGEGVWDLRQYKDLNPEQRIEKTFNEMRSMIGQPTLEAWRYLCAKFATGLPEDSAIMGIFYYYRREPESIDYIQEELRVLFPFKVAINPDLLSWDWINRQREDLAQKWDLSPVSFGISGNIYSSHELESVLPFSKKIGELGEHWFSSRHRRILSKQTGRAAFMVFGDIDKKTSDEQFMSASRQLGTPFLVADTTKGHHILFPLLFKSYHSRDARMEIEVGSKIGLVVGIDLHDRHIFHSLQNYEYVLRVTPGLGREEVPKISALVWDGSTIVRSSNRGER